MWLLCVLVSPTSVGLPQPLQASPGSLMFTFLTIPCEDRSEELELQCGAMMQGNHDNNCWFS